MQKKEANTNPKNTPAIGSNTTEKKKKIGHNEGQNQGQNRDLSQITYWNHDKKDHYVTNYTKPPKSKNLLQSWLLL